MARKKIVVLVLLILLSSCKVQRDSYCFYEKAPFKMDLIFQSKRNRITNWRMITQIDLTLMKFNDEEIEEYISEFEKVNEEFMEYIEIDLQQNNLIITERYPLDDSEFLKKCEESGYLNYHSGYRFNRELTIEEMHKLGFTCHS